MSELEGDAMSAEDRRLVDRLRSAYQPEPLEAAERLAFDAALEERRRRRPLRLFSPAVAVTAATAAMALIWALAWPGFEAAPEPAGRVRLAEAGWTERLLDPSDWQADGTELLGPEGASGSRAVELPDEYTAIAAVFLDE